MKPQLKHKILFIALNIVTQFLMLVFILKNDLFDISFPGSDSGPGSSLTSILFSISSPFLILLVSAVIWHILKFKEVVKISALSFIVSVLFWGILIVVSLTMLDFSGDKNAEVSRSVRAIAHKKNLDLILSTQESYAIEVENINENDFDGYLIKQAHQDGLLLRMSERGDLTLSSTRIPPIDKYDSTAILYYTLAALKPFIRDTIYDEIESSINRGKVSYYNYRVYDNSCTFWKDEDYYTPYANYSLIISKRDTVFKIYIHKESLNRIDGLENLAFF